MASDPLIKSRFVGEQDPARAFVLASWVASYRETACDQLGVTEQMDQLIVLEFLRRQVRELACENALRVACLAADEDTFVGWVCGDPRMQTIHYVYVKSAWREQGIASQLISEIVQGPGYYTFATHKHKKFMCALRNKQWRWRLLKERL